MDDKKAIRILSGMIEKYSLDEEEKEAIHAAIGILSWTSLAQSRIKAMKKKQEKSAEWCNIFSLADKPSASHLGRLKI